MPEHRPEYIVERVRQRLAVDERVAELELQVSVVAGRVVVSGTVPTEERREGVAAVVAETVPDLEVVNQTEVLDTDAAPREETIE